jgi:hypothetical protein
LHLRLRVLRGGLLRQDEAIMALVRLDNPWAEGACRRSREACPGLPCVRPGQGCRLRQAARGAQQARSPTSTTCPPRFASATWASTISPVVSSSAIRIHRPRLRARPVERTTRPSPLGLMPAATTVSPTATSVPSPPASGRESAPAKRPPRINEPLVAAY